MVKVNTKKTSVISNFEFPEFLYVPKTKVQFRNVQIDPKKMTFSLEYAFDENRRIRKFNFTKVEGKITLDLKKWLTKVIVKDGVKTTPFRLHLQRLGFDMSGNELPSQILKSIEWSVDNQSEDSDEFPFRLQLNGDNAYLHRVVNNDRVVVSEYEDFEKGESVKKWGYRFNSSMMKREYFRRLEIKNLSN